MPTRYAKNPLARLKQQTISSAQTAEAEIERVRRNIRREIMALTRELDVGGSADAREKVFEEVERQVRRLEKRLERVEDAALRYAAKAGVEDGGEKTGLAVKYSKERADEMINLVAGDRGRRLAAVFTENMAGNVINALRNATVAAMRENAVAGGSKKELARVLEEKWLGAAKRGETYEFIDSSGRVWDTKTYVVMNVRTNAMRVYNDSLAHTIGDVTGSDLVMVSSGGDPDCRLCFPWEGRILSLTGKTRGFPTYEQARQAGCFHPNCTHTLEPVDELLDEEEIELQRDHPIDAANATPEELDENRYRIDIDRKVRNEGLSEDEARVAVDRDNLTAAIRVGLLQDDAREIVDGMNDAQVEALCPDGNPPSFEPTKRVKGGTRDNPRYEDEVWRRGTRGGTVHIARDADLDRILDVCGVRDAAPAEPILDEYGFPRSIADSKMTVISDTIGGTTGAKLVEIGGERFILKQDGKVSAEHILNEAAADQAYLRAGVRVPDCRTYQEDGRTYKLSRFIDGGTNLGKYLKTATPAQREAVIGELKEGYLLDVLFANWDVLGANQDNVLVDADGHAWRIDNGSAFGFRAQGERKKPEEFEKREWPDEWRTLRTSAINRGVFDGLTAHDIFSSRIDLEAAVAGLPDETKNALAKPMEEIRQMRERCADFDRGGYVPETTSFVLECSYDLSKESFREEVPKQISYGNYGYCRKGGIKNPGTLPDYSSIIKTAAISINKHAGFGSSSADYTPNAHSIQKALSLKGDLQMYAKTDQNAQTLLGFVQQIEQAQATGWHLKSKFPNVPNLTVTPSGVFTPKKYQSLTEHLFDYAESKFGVDPMTKKPNIDPGEITSLYKAQGEHSWEGGNGIACRLKILNLSLRGENWETPSQSTFTGGPRFHSYYKAQVAFYKTHPDRLEHDKKALCLWKAASQLLLENADFDGNHHDGKFIYSVRTNGKARFAGMKKGMVNPAYQIGGCESGSVFESVTALTDGVVGVRRIPFSRINSLYFMDGSPTSSTMFLGDDEREVSSDLTGLPVYYPGAKGRGWDIAAHTQELDAAFAAWDKAHP